MNRAATWILGSISGVFLAMGVQTLGLSASYGASSSCTTVGDGPPCTPTLAAVALSFPPQGPMLAIGAMLMLLAVLIGLPAWIASPILAERRGATGKTPIIVVSVLATALLVVTLVSVSVFSPALRTPQTCFNGIGPCVTGPEARLVALVGIGLMPIVSALLVGMPAWTMGLVQTARSRHWGWFAAIAMLSPVATLLYGVVGPQGRRAAQA
jgi:hypothetical protein